MKIFCIGQANLRASVLMLLSHGARPSEEEMRDIEWHGKKGVSLSIPLMFNHCNVHQIEMFCLKKELDGQGYGNPCQSGIEAPKENRRVLSFDAICPLDIDIDPSSVSTTQRLGVDILVLYAND
jgi:hypothetical protein